MNKTLLVILIFPALIMYSQEDIGRGDTFRKGVVAEVHDQLKICDFEENRTISEVKTTHETFQVCELTDACDATISFKTYKVESYEAPTIYQELYFTKKDVLVFARETEVSVYGNDTIQWRCDYFFEKGKLVDFISLGHGKTEEEDWDPESIITKFEERVAQQ